jgi:signal transduction histidine kinase
MLHEFLTLHRADLIERCKSKVAERTSANVVDADLRNGVPRFLDQLIKTLQLEQTSMPMDSRRVSGPAGGGMPVLSEIGASAAQHGNELLNSGFTIEQVVHDYGDLCQAITDLACELGGSIEVDEFRTLNRCLDNAIAEAVTEFSYQRDLGRVGTEVRALNEKWGEFAHESRHSLHAALLALAAVKSGKVGLSGPTGNLLERELNSLRHHMDRFLSGVRLAAGMPPRYHLTSVAGFIAELAASASLEAQLHQCDFTVSAVDPELAMDVDRDILSSAVGNLLQNAFRFTRLHSEVSLHVYAAADRIMIDVEDCCGGLPPGDTERMFLPFTQVGANKAGVGLGLSICRRNLESLNGTVGARSIPGKGCVFTIDLPRYALSDMAVWNHTPIQPRPAVAD